MRYKPVHTWLSVSQETQVRVFFDFFQCFLWQKVSERTVNSTVPATNTLIQLLILYTDRDSHSAQRYRPTDGRT